MPPLAHASDPCMVVTPLVPDRFEIMLRERGILDDWKHIIHGIRYGFDVGVRESLTSTLLFNNHASTTLDETFITTYIHDEQEDGRYSHAFQPHELEATIGPFRTAPLGLVPKPHSDKFRLIQDLSYPRQDPDIASVNSGVNADLFPTAWGTFDEVSAAILTLPPGCVAATFDISAAYRLTPVRPDQQNSLCVMWKGQVFVDRALCFGLASSTGVFGAIADMLVAIYAASDFGLIKKWVDDFFVIRFPHQHFTEHDFLNLTEAAGVLWSHTKT